MIFRYLFWYVKYDQYYLHSYYILNKTNTYFRINQNKDTNLNTDNFESLLRYFWLLLAKICLVVDLEGYKVEKYFLYPSGAYLPGHPADVWLCGVCLDVESRENKGKKNRNNFQNKILEK